MLNFLLYYARTLLYYAPIHAYYSHHIILKNQHFKTERVYALLQYLGPNDSYIAA